MKPKTTIIIMALAALALAPITSNAQTDNKWSFDVSLNGLAAGLSGNATVHGVNADVDVGFDKVLEHLKFGAMGAVRVGYDRWALNTELMYFHLAGSKRDFHADVEQWLVEPSLSYRVCDYFEALAGARYNNFNVEITGPFGRERSGTQEWWDPIVGGIVHVPLVSKLSFNVRGDVGGFDVGSDITWQAFPYLSWQFTKWGSLEAGYRWLYVNYSTGSGSSKFRYDILTQGPQVGFTFHF